MKRFTALMRHSYQTVLLMCKTQNNTYHFKQKIVMALLGIVLVVLGMSNFSSVAGMVFVMVGCFFFTSLDMPARSQADDIKKALGGKYPQNKYEFFDNHFVLYASTQDIINYSRIVKLVEDSQYCYLYIEREASYMLEKFSLGNELNEFKAFMSKATGLEWQQPYSFTTFNLKAMIRLFKSEEETAGKRRKKNKKK